MTRQVINHGTVPNDGTGESPFTAFQKVNAMTAELYLNNLDQPSSYVFGARLQSFAESLTYGSATIAHTRNFDCNCVASTGLVSTFAHNVAAYDYDAKNLRLRYFSNGAQIDSAINTSDNHRNLTHADWVATNMTSARTQVGVDGASNTATLLTATANDATHINSTITQSSTLGTTSAYIKRSAGRGRVWMTRDGGTTWVDVSSGLNAVTWIRPYIQDTRANPDVGFRLEFSGDAIIVDVVNTTNRAALTTPLLTRPYDLRGSSLTYSSLSPSLATGRRWLISFRVIPNADAALSQGNPTVAIYSTSTTTDSYIVGLATSNLAPLVQSYSGGVNQINNNVATAVPVATIDADNLLEFAVGLRQATAFLNGVPLWTFDGFGASDIDPAAALDTIALSGSGRFADLYIQEMRGLNVVIYGDSQTSESLSLPTLLRSKQDLRQVTIHARSYSGQVLDTLTSNVSTYVTPAFNSRAVGNVLVIFGGTNTLQDGAVSAAQCIVDLQELVTACAAVGTWQKICVATILPRSAGFSGGVTQSSFNTARETVNAAIVAGLTDVDEVIDIAAVSELSNANWATGAYVLDGIHLTPAGYALIAPMFARAIGLR